MSLVPGGIREDLSLIADIVEPGARVRIWGVLTVVDDFREVKAQRVEML